MLTGAYFRKGFELPTLRRGLFLILAIEERGAGASALLVVKIQEALLLVILTL